MNFDQRSGLDWREKGKQLGTNTPQGKKRQLDTITAQQKKNPFNIRIKESPGVKIPREPRRPSGMNIGQQKKQLLDIDIRQIEPIVRGWMSSRK